MFNDKICHILLKYDMLSIFPSICMFYHVVLLSLISSMLS